MIISLRSALAAGSLAIFTATVLTQRLAADWPQWRGPSRTGEIGTLTTPSTWPDRLHFRWKKEVGLGYASPVVIGDRVYMHSRRGDEEVVAAFDSRTGEQLWQASYPAPYKIDPVAAPSGLGPKATPAYADGRLFTFGISGILSAFETATGKLLWRRPAPPVGPAYTTSMSPLIDRGLLIVHVGGNNQGALTAFEPATGRMVWQWTGDGPGYGSPVVVELAGMRQLVTYTQEHIVGVNVETGELLWRIPFKTPYVVNAQTPLILGDMVIVTGLERGMTGFRISRQQDRWSTSQVWRNDNLWMHLSNGVLLGDNVFGLSPQDKGRLFLMDAKTGTLVWSGQGRTADNAAIAKKGDLLFVLKDDGELMIGRAAAGTGFTPLRTYRVAESATWAQPAISGNRLFVKDVSTLTLWTLD
jgi:outer membrane protein assembly factor BamB